MSQEQPSIQPAYTYEKKPGVFATKIPSAVVLGIGVLLFFLPFIDVRCNGMSLATISGVQLATGYTIDKEGKSNSIDIPVVDEKVTVGDKEKGERNPMALAALILGAVSFIVAIALKKNIIGIITSVLTAAALIALMVDIRSQIDKRIKLPDAGTLGGEDDFLGLKKLGMGVGDKMAITVEFTPWFYIAVAAFLAGAFFCYKRWRSEEA